MKTVILFRHAKSAWDDPDLADHDRPLNARGRLSAPLMGVWLAARGLVPDHVICSSSLRTRETWALARAVLPGAPEAAVAPRLYHADPETMLALLRAAPDAAACVAMIGHQPGISAFARLLAADPVAPACARAFQHYPTGAVAVLEVDADRWADVVPGAARFTVFAAPREVA